MALTLLFLLVSLAASTIGAISGMGGGVIIKPVLDAAGVLSVSSISFLSGCTVLAMSTVSMLRNTGKNGIKLELKRSLPLGLGAALGGVLGKYLFNFVEKIFPSQEAVGLTQAATLLILTLFIFVFVIYRSKVKTLKVENAAACVAIGLALGLISAFLGIGGGPFNVAVLFYFFTMETKTASVNSLFVVFLSQIASLIFTFMTKSAPSVDPITLIVMIIGGICGALIGSHLLKKMSQAQVDTFFKAVMIIVMLINLFNILKFAGFL